MSIKVGRNDACPCGELAKFKNCCDGHVEWETILRENPAAAPRYFSARGKNLAFLQILAKALHWDSPTTTSWGDVKQACTPKAIAQIHEGLVTLWPDGADLDRVLQKERRGQCGLYVGRYDFDTIAQGLTRHIIYSDRIILCDPFTDPRAVRDQFSPLANPQRHRINTLKWSWLWLNLAEWIEAGLVVFVRDPSDFDARLRAEAFEVSSTKAAAHPELREALKVDTKTEMEGGAGFDKFREFRLLSVSDEQIARLILESHPEATQPEITAVLTDIQRQRDAHPYFVDVSTSGPAGEIVIESAGTNYYVAKLMANSTGAHLITDLTYRWREIEMDRAQGGAELGPWSAFAKAFQDVSLKFLDRVPLNLALKLRKEDRLERMRGLLRRAWDAARSNDDFDERNAVALADELTERIAESDHEWSEIGRELAKVLTVDAGLAVAGTTVAPGSAGWLAGGAVIAGLGIAGVTWHRRNRFSARYPAAFFLDLKRAAK